MKGAEMTAPELTKEQRQANLEKAMRIRKERSEIRAKISNGIYTAAIVAQRALECEQAYAGMRVKQLINAMPGYGFKRTQALMKELHIAENKRVGGLGSVQAANLIMKLDGVEQ